MYIKNPKDPKKQIKNSKTIMKNLNKDLSNAQFALPVDPIKFDQSMNNETL